MGHYSLHSVGGLQLASERRGGWWGDLAMQRGDPGGQPGLRRGAHGCGLVKVTWVIIQADL